MVIFAKNIIQGHWKWRRQIIYDFLSV